MRAADASAGDLTSEHSPLGALYRLTDKLYRARALPEVFAAALDAIGEALGCDRSSILLFDEFGVMQFVAWRGLSDGYRKALSGHSPWTVSDREPLPITVEDIDRANEPEWIKNTIRAEGIRGLSFVPLVVNGQVVGKFMTYYAAPHVFSSTEVDVAVLIARQVGFSLERVRADAARATAEAELQTSEERFRQMIEQAPVMIWTSDASGRCLHLNSMLRSFWNVALEDLSQFDWQTSMHPDDAARIGREMAAATAGQRSVSLRGRYLDSQRRYRLLQTEARPHFSSKGEFLGLIGVNTDITDKEEAANALRKSEERFRLAVEAAPSGMVITDPKGRIVLVNAVAERLFGYARDELTGQEIEVLVPGRFRDAHPRFRNKYSVQPGSRPMGSGRDLFATRKDGTEVPVEIGLSPIETSEGVMTMAAIVDISERKHADAQRELLVAELNHRVKNTLAVVQSIAHQTFKGSETSNPARAAFEGRLMALAAAHNLLTQANWGSTSLKTLAFDTLLAGEPNTSRVSLKGPNVNLTPKEALAIAMALHELFTNALKYGALSNGSGCVAVEWTTTKDPELRLKLTWSEHGGPAVAPPQRKGFGSLMVERALAQDLDGEVKLDFRPEGLVCEIDAPLQARRTSLH